jgi:hypothetical protein
MTIRHLILYLKKHMNEINYNLVILNEKMLFGLGTIEIVN